MAIGQSACDECLAELREEQKRAYAQRMKQADQQIQSIRFAGRTISYSDSDFTPEHLE